MTHKIHARYMSDTKGYIRGYVSRALLAGALGYPQTPEIRVPHVSRMYPACIPHVSRMYPACLNSYQIHLSLDAFEIHVSHHVSWMYPACILITLADTCISHVSRMYLASQIRTSSWRIQDTCIVILYLGVSWCIIRCIVMKSPRYTYPDVSWYVSSVTPRKRPRYMYLDVSDMYPKMYLGLVWDTCKIHAKYQDTCILLECNRAFKIHFEIHQDT
jgi:hypothetical protein